MAITVTPLLTTLDDAEDDALWSSGSANTDVRKESTSSIGVKISNTTGAISTLATPFTAVDMSTGDHIYWWLLSSGVLDTTVNGGIRITLYTDGTNYRTWYVGGSDNYSGGWKCFCLDPTATGSVADTGTYNSASITNVGISFKTIAKVSGNISYCVWDICRYGTGLRITSGVADGITWEDIYLDDSDNANAYGVIDKQNGTYIMQGKFVFGNAGSAANIDFGDTDSLCLWQQNEFQSTTLNEIRVEGNSGSDTINFEIGTKVGTGDSAVGASGNLIRALDSTNQPWKLDLTNTNIDIANLYGSTLAGMTTSSIANTIVEMVSVTIDSSAQLTVGLADVFNCTVSNSTDTQGAVLLPSADTHVMRLTAFNNNSRAIELDTYDAGGYTANALTFSGNTYDYNNTSGTTMDVAKTNGSNPSTYDTGNSIVTFSASFNHILEGLELNTEVTYVTANTSTELFNVENATVSDGAGKYKTTYVHSGGASVDILVHHIDYKPDISNVYTLSLPNAEATIKITQFLDENYKNP